MRSRPRAQGRMEPILALWVPLLALAALIFWMYHVLAHRPGGQPIGALERAFTRRRRGPSAGSCRRRGRHDQPAILPVAAARLLHGQAVRHAEPRGSRRAGPGADDARPARRVRARSWQCPAMAKPSCGDYVVAAPSAAGLALPALFGPARDADRLRRAQPAQRGRGDEGGGHLGAPDARAADRRQPRHRGACCSSSTRRWSSTRTAQVTAWSDNDYRPVPPESGIVSNVWLLARRRPGPGGPCRRARRRLPRRGLTIYDREGGVLQRVVQRRSRRSAGRRMEARRRPDLRFDDERRPPLARNDRAGGRRARAS